MSRPIVWSPAARALFSLDRSTAVSAGAGAGKTTCVVELCVRLLSGEATGTPLEPGELVAITFTEKAAEELEERLRAAVAARARAAVAQAPGSDDARAWLRRLHALDAMAIGTIHGFASRMLREHAVEAGLDPDAVVLDEDGAGELRRAAARAAVLAAADAGRPETLALCAAGGAIGGRGALAEVVAELVRDRASRGLGGPLTPAPAPAAEAEAVRAEVLRSAEALRGLRAAVGSASGAAAMARLEEAWGAVAPEDRAGAFTFGAVRRLGALGDALSGWRVGKRADPEQAAGLKDALRGACERLVPLAAAVLAAPAAAEIALLAGDAAERYAARKAGARALDFDDLLSRARDLLRGDAALRAQLRGRVRALLVDEYQDVNGLQQELFDLLAGPAAGEPRPLLVGVGDLKQSIYRFRGADVAVFRGLVERFAGGGEGRVLHLAENHRSSPEILAVVNAVSASCMQPPGPDARPYELTFAEGDRLVPVRPPAGAPACELLEDAGEGTAPERRAREAWTIARRIEAILSGDAGLAVRERADGEGERARRPRAADVAILFRRLTQIAPYVEALRAAGIPYRLARGGGFHQAPEVRDLGELLAAVNDPGDAIAWAALLRSPLCAVSDATLLRLARGGLPRLERETPDVEGVEGERLRRFLAVWRRLRASRERLGPGALLQLAVDELDLEAAHLAAPEGERRLANLRKALALARRFEAGGGTPGAFAARLRALAGRPPREPEAELEAGDAVALLSVHQAKGLEWPVVFVPDLGAPPRADGRAVLLDGAGRVCASAWDPDREEPVASEPVLAARREEARAAAAESRRLLYVALTRARDHLVLSGAPGKRGGVETWRALVEAGLAAHPELVRRVPAAEARTACAGAPLPAEPRRPEPTAPRLAPPPLRPEARAPAVRLAVTALAEYARCPRRHWLLHRAGVAEPDRIRGAGQDDPGRATVRGTLAHAMLSEIDLAAPPLERRAQLAAVAARRGHDPAAPGVRRIAGDVWRFLDSPAGRDLARAARAGTLRRELPFVLRLDGDGVPAAYLTGAIDALLEEPRAVTVVDFKYALPRPGAAERYRGQLLAYVAAAARARPGAAIRARVQFLRGPCTAIDVTPSRAELDRFAREAPFAAARAVAGGEPAQAPGLGRDEARCHAEGCGFVSRCWRP